MTEIESLKDLGTLIELDTLIISIFGVGFYYSVRYVWKKSKARILPKVK